VSPFSVRSTLSGALIASSTSDSDIFRHFILLLAWRVYSTITGYLGAGFSVLGNLSPVLHC
jgi:hypothetical protein